MKPPRSLLSPCRALFRTTQEHSTSTTRPGGDWGGCNLRGNEVSPLVTRASVSLVAVADRVRDPGGDLWARRAPTCLIPCSSDSCDAARTHRAIDGNRSATLDGRTTVNLQPASLTCFLPRVSWRARTTSRPLTRDSTPRIDSLGPRHGQSDPRIWSRKWIAIASQGLRHRLKTKPALSFCNWDRAPRSELRVNPRLLSRWHWVSRDTLRKVDAFPGWVLEGFDPKPPRPVTGCGPIQTNRIPRPRYERKPRRARSAPRSRWHRGHGPAGRPLFSRRTHPSEWRIVSPNPPLSTLAPCPPGTQVTGMKTLTRHARGKPGPVARGLPRARFWSFVALSKGCLGSRFGLESGMTFSTRSERRYLGRCPSPRETRASPGAHAVSSLGRPTRNVTRGTAPQNEE